MNVNNQCSKGWSFRCSIAKSPICRCECDGQNHGNPMARQGKIFENEKRFAVPLELVRSDMKGKIVGIRNNGQPIIYVNGEWLSPEYSQSLVNHSPDGFEWGYGGSGPAQLALAIALKFCNKNLALALYHQFKWEYIANIPRGQGFELDYEIVKNWFYQNSNRDSQAVNKVNL